ncbi:MAG TPA: LON peptidase substrate-binding domain-containing protein [Phycisphaerae bacterium]
MHLEPIHFEHEVALFPLPNCVLFPGAVQPLHIFEPRYREMMRATLAGGTRHPPLTMALLEAGWEKTYHAAPSIHAIACAGRIIAHELLPDGKYNLLLQGVSRVRVISEEKFSGDWGTYRKALLQPLMDVEPSPSHEVLQRRVISRLFEKSSLRNLTITPALAPLFEEAVPLSRLIDALAFSIVQDIPLKQQLLETTDVAARGELLLRELVALAGRLEPASNHSSPAGTTWPPALGVN